MDSTLVIKVKYGDTLRRFNAQITDDDKLDLDMNGLREKIRCLFNFPTDAELALTYVDEDGDIVTLVDDDDLLDVTKQRLKFLKINVNLNKHIAKSSGSSTPRRSPRVQNPLPDINSAVVADALKSLPESVRETLSKLSLDLALKATSSSSVMKELVECAFKMGQSMLNSNEQSEGAMSNTVASEVPNVPNDVNGQTSKERFENVTRGVGLTVKPIPAPVDLNFVPDSDINQAATKGDDSKGATRPNAANLGKRPVGVGPSSDSNNSARLFAFGKEYPFSSTPVGNDVSAPSPLRQWSAGRVIGPSVGMFHRGVQCDGCGVHPITGPRYKSKVIDDYDLCSICFAQMGNESDYIKMDRPVTYRRPRSFKGFHDPNSLVPPLSTPVRPYGINPVRYKFDSRFIMDVNVLDGTMMDPSENFTKIWRMRNTGSDPWPEGSRLVWIGGDKFSLEVSAELEVPANGLPVDGELDVAVDFTSPEPPGRYISYWRMATPSGTKFGQRVWVLIQVDAAKNDTNPNGGLNLNMPPDSNPNEQQPLLDSGLQESGGYSASAPLLEKPIEIPEKDQDLNFPIDNYLLVGEGVPEISPKASSPVSYPIIDLSEALVQSEAPAHAADVASSSEDAREKKLLEELEQMGFKQVGLNKEILRLNEYDLEQSVDDLCGVSEWDPILEELQEMGFCDESKNKKLLKKNNGSIRRVVMDLLTGDEA